MRRTLVVMCTLAISVLGLASPAGATIDTGASAASIASAIAEDPAIITGASFVSVPPEGTPNAVSTTPLASFPTDDASYGILSTGDASLAPTENLAGNDGWGDAGDNVRGDTDYDVTVLAIDMNVPAEATCLSFDFRFLSEEFPEFVNTQFNDAFIAELDSTTWSTSGSEINIGNDFAFDPTQGEISINAAGETSMSAGAAAGTTYDGATPLLEARTPITPGAHTLYLSIFDQGDTIYDSAVFLDDLAFSSGGNCAAGASSPNKPDGMVRFGTTTAYVGDGIYNDTAAGQIKIPKASRGDSKVFNVRFQNDGSIDDSIVVKGCDPVAGFKVKYMAGTDDITTEVNAGTYATASMPTGAKKTLKATVKVLKSGSGKFTCLIRGTSAANPFKGDTVGIGAKVV